MLVTCGGVLNLCVAHLKMQMTHFYLVCHFSTDVSYSSSVCVCLLLYILRDGFGKKGTKLYIPNSTRAFYTVFSNIFRRFRAIWWLGYLSNLRHGLGQLRLALGWEPFSGSARPGGPQPRAGPLATLFLVSKFLETWKPMETQKLFCLFTDVLEWL